ncbi:MAG: dethiobiotin synthase [Planctomycetota bacterium]|nr:dethiobiotin synthase [Planctomycetota bacterium]
MSSIPPFFITGTDTEVGKTHFSVRWLRHRCDKGVPGVVYKPVASGVEDIVPEGEANPDVIALSRASGNDMSELCLHTYRHPMAPEMARRLEGDGPSPDQIINWCKERIRPNAAFEGIGGLFVPLHGRFCVADLIRELELPVVLVARAGLGTVNHTLLSVRAVRDMDIKLASVVVSMEMNRGTPVEEKAIHYLKERLFPIPLGMLEHSPLNSSLSDSERDFFTVFDDILKNQGT